jgi:hypothetical protein
LTPLLGTPLGGCGGGGPDEMTVAAQLELTSSQAVAAINDGSLSS